MSTAYKNGKIYTVNPDQPWAEALVVEDGVIVAIGTEEDIRPRITEDTDEWSWRVG